MMNVQQYEPVPDDGQSTVSKAADIAIWYKNNGGLCDARFKSICQTWGVDKDELNIEMEGRV